MKAAILRVFGEPLSIEEAETPTSDADEALVGLLRRGPPGARDPL